MEEKIKQSGYIEYVDKLGPIMNLLKYDKDVEHFQVLTHLPHQIIAMFTGNQAGKTASAAMQYVLRVFGLHPIEDKNRLGRNIRCLSSSLPVSKDENESTNMQYHELKKFLPYECIIKDVTARSSVLKVSSPVHGFTWFDFMSWKQDLTDTASVQRCSLWEDEEPPKVFREESRRRLLARGGDEVITLTPKNGLSYLYDDIWNKKSYLYRSETISKVLNLPRKTEDPEGDRNIACIQIATDDNPTMTKESIDINFEDAEPEDVMVSRYGVFKQITGRVHKTYERDIHYISYDKYFPDGVPYEWTHSRGIDYHESRTPWSVGWMSASKEDEWFLWQEFHPVIDGPHAMTTSEITKSMARKSGDYYYIVNLIDPLANKKQPNTLTSTTEDINRYLWELREEHGIGTESFFEGWDTKGGKGRDEVQLRFKNAKKVGKPFNNLVIDKAGIKRRLPTLWICDTCPNFDNSVRKWSYNEWATAQTRSVNDAKNTPRPRYSHDNMVLECLAKDIRLKVYDAPHFVSQRPHRVSATGRGYRTMPGGRVRSRYYG
jgi:hypothetical protein